MIKKIIISTAIFAALTSISVFAKADPVIIQDFYGEYAGVNSEIFYADGSKSTIGGNQNTLLYINGSIAKNVDVIIDNNRSLVPVRIISENLGAQVGWSDAERKVTITENNIVLKIGDKTASVNGQNVELDAAPKIYNDLTYVPLRFIAENLNCNVDFADNNSEKALTRDSKFIYVDNKETDEKILYTKEQAEEILQTKLSKHLELFVENFDKNNTQEGVIIESALPILKDDINNMKFVSEVSRYYIFETPYKFIFDKYTGDIYVYRVPIGRTIKPYDESDTMFFGAGYWAG